MLTYKAIYKFVDGGVHAEVVDFPGVITCGKDLDEARRMLAGALVEMAETSIALGEALPQPQPDCKVGDADVEELIHLVLRVETREPGMPEAAAA